MTASQSRTNTAREREIERHRMGGKEDENQKNNEKNERRQEVEMENSDKTHAELLLCLCDLFGAVFVRRKKFRKKAHVVFILYSDSLYADIL